MDIFSAVSQACALASKRPNTTLFFVLYLFLGAIQLYFEEQAPIFSQNLSIITTSDLYLLTVASYYARKCIKDHEHGSAYFIAHFINVSFRYLEVLL
jgi:hypothetical protein